MKSDVFLDLVAAHGALLQDTILRDVARVAGDLFQLRVEVADQAS